MNRNKKKYIRQNQQRFPNPAPRIDFLRREQWSLSIPDELPLYPFCMEEARRNNHSWFSENFSRFMIVTLVVEGSILYTFQDKEHLVTPGKILVIPPNGSYFFRTGPTGKYEKIVLEFMGKNLLPIAESLHLNRYLILEPDDMKSWVAAIRTIGDMIQNRSLTDLPVLLGKSFEFLTRLSFMIPREKDHSGILAQTQMYLESNLDKKITMRDTANEFGISTATLLRLFRDKLSVSPMRYRIECKVARARYLLSHTSLSVKEIAFELGYCNQFYFSREFRRITGVSPSKLRVDFTTTDR